MTTLEKIKNLTYVNFVNKIKEILTETLSALDAATGSIPTDVIGEAPQDGKMYARKNGVWEEIV